MSRSILALLLLASFVAAAVGLVFIFFHGDSTGDPAAALPSSVGAALLAPSLPTLLKSLATTRMAPAPGDSGWDLLSAITRELLEARGIAFDPDPAVLARTLRGGAALGWIPPESKNMAAMLIVALELPSRQSDLLGLVEREILPGLGDPGAVATRRAHGGQEYLAIRNPGSSATVCVSGFGRIAVVTLSPEAMRRALSTLARREPGLVEDPLFKRVLSDLRGRSDLLAYLSGRFVTALLAGREAGTGGTNSWLGAVAPTAGIQAAGISLLVDRDGLFRERGRALIPGISATPAGKVFEGRPHKTETAAFLPLGFPFYLTASFSRPEAIMEGLPGWLSPVTGQEPAHLKERLLGLEAFLGLDLSRDLLSVIGHEGAIAFDRSPGNPFVLALRPADSLATRRLLARMDGLARAADAYRTTPSPGGTITTYEHPRLLPARPSYMFIDPALLIAASPEHLERIVRAGSGRGADDRSAEDPFPVEPAHVTLVADTERTITWIRDLSGGRDRSGREVAWLRRLRDLLPGASGPLPPVSVSIDVTRDGLAGEWRAPLSPLILTTLLLAIPGDPPAGPIDEVPPARNPLDATASPGVH